MFSNDYGTGLMIQCCGTDGADPFSSLRPELLSMPLDRFISRRCSLAIESIRGASARPAVLGAWMPGGKFTSPADFGQPERRSWSDSLTVSDWALDYWRDFGRICARWGVKAGFYLPTLWLAELSSSYRLNRERLDRLFRLIECLGAEPWVVFDALHGASVGSPGIAAQRPGSFGDQVVRLLTDMGCHIDGEPFPRVDTIAPRIGTFCTVQVRNQAAKVRGADAFNASDEAVAALPRRWMWINDVDADLAGRDLPRVDGVISTLQGARADGWCPLVEATLDFWRDPAFVRAI